jgi:GT2 family glycosyltransferase
VSADGKFLARGRERFRVKGVTYGPFAPDAEGQPFPAAERVRADFALMRGAHINSVRTYHVPPAWFLRLADEEGMSIFVDVPWPKHLCFLESAQAQQEARRQVRRAAERGRDHPCTLAYSIANEVPPDIIRWHGARRVERFLAELCDVAKQADPLGLVTYANYPPTEYLDLSFLDFVTFNVYLHDRETFRRYLFRLQNLVGDRPLLLGELGMDTLRHGELKQARFLAGHLRETLLTGLAGGFVFAWTDDWHTGGCRIDDWAFGLTSADRSAKPAYHSVGEVFGAPPAGLLPEAPRVSVVVCSYNGGRTLGQCLQSLLALDYPDYEVIVVDDGSTDDTRAVLARFPAVRAIHQANQGLSAARNVGLQAATGSVIAYTDSDCFADPDWLTQLVYQLGRSGAAAVGGPNLTPEDGRLAACVAAAPGQPTHVLENDQVAEHIPGCNMAFRRAALEAINGFDPAYRKAGDDVDVCWRLQQAGYWITFAPGAFVWHHRRQNPRSFLRQQAGYGEAEALLRFKHPDRFNGRGDGKWRGVLYGASLLGLRLSPAIIYRGTFATGFFQCVYQPGPAHWAMLPGTLEWHVAAALVGLSALFWAPAWMVAAAMLVLSLGVAVLQAAQARLPARHDGFPARCVVAALCYLQPLVRSWARYHTRIFSYRALEANPAFPQGPRARLLLRGACTVAYWSEEGRERTELLNRILTYLNAHRWAKVIDTGWSDWDVRVHCHPWTFVEVCTAQEGHANGRRLIRLRYRLRPSRYTKGLAAVAALAAVVTAGLADWPAAATAPLLLGAGAVIGAACLGAWWRGSAQASRVVAVFDSLARGLGLIRLGSPAPKEENRRESEAAAP